MVCLLATICSELSPQTSFLLTVARMVARFMAPQISAMVSLAVLTLIAIAAAAVTSCRSLSHDACL